MKRIITLVMAAMCMLHLSTDLIAQDTECISHEQDGSQTLRVTGKGRNKFDALEQAKKNAVYDIIFVGVRQGNNGYDQRPLVTTVNAREKYREYFDAFFADNGEYLNYIDMSDRRLGSTTKRISSTQVSVRLTVRVLIPQLRQKLINDNIIKK